MYDVNERQPKVLVEIQVESVNVNRKDEEKPEKTCGANSWR